MGNARIETLHEVSRNAMNVTIFVDVIVAFLRNTQTWIESDENKRAKCYSSVPQKHCIGY